jgi:two-component sensor histidine kinase
MPNRLPETRLPSWFGQIAAVIAAGIASFLAARVSIENVWAALFAVSMSALILAVFFVERQNHARALKDSNERLRLLLAELDHRVKNVLATVSAVAAQTKDTSRSMEEFVTALEGRIRSMASAHELLSFRRWQGIPVAALVRRELAAYATSDNVEIDGPEIMLSPHVFQAIAMVVHELATNAAKHGALSTQSGRVSVRWNRKLNGRTQFVSYGRKAGDQGSKLQKNPAMARA